jgi:hypothetical protein
MVRPYRLAKESLRSPDTAIRAAQGVDSFAELVHCPVEIALTPSNRNRGLIDECQRIA